MYEQLAKRNKMSGHYQFLYNARHLVNFQLNKFLRASLTSQDAAVTW